MQTEEIKETLVNTFILIESWFVKPVNYNENFLGSWEHLNMEWDVNFTT